MRFPRTASLLVLAVSLVFSSLSIAQPVDAGGRSCTGWTNRKVEPKVIRILDTRTGQVHKVKFKRYVAQVMASGEWPGRLPNATLKAGAMATKQFAWYYTLKGNWRGGVSRGRCYDVVNTTQDQLWQHWAKPVPSQKRAVDAVWGLSAWKWNTRFFLTGYRAGTTRICGADANGWKLYASSASSCAKQGWSWKRILKKYYSKTAFRWNSEALASRAK